MSDVSLQKTSLTPREEDHALFSHPLGQCEVALIPKFHTNDRNEHVIHGFLQRSTEVEVLFSGRRRGLANPLIERLMRLWNHAQKAGSERSPAQPEHVRLPVAVYGSWRSHFTQEPDGWQTKRVQLIAAIWRIHDATGRPITRGSAPMLPRVANNLRA